MKTVPELKFCSGTTAWALLYQGKYAGKVIANWSDNPAGSTCSASVIVWRGPLEQYEGLNIHNVGRAGGISHDDKLEIALLQCLDNAGVIPMPNLIVDAWLRDIGYEICTVLP